MFEGNKITYLYDLYWGSSAKGQTAAYLAIDHRPSALITNSSPSASHTVTNKIHTEDGEKEESFVFKCLPSASAICRWEDYEPAIFIAPSAILDIDQLKKEAEWIGIDKKKIHIAATCPILEEKHSWLELERMGGENKLGSTLSGQSACMSEKIARSKDLSLAKDMKRELKDFTVLHFPDYQNAIIDNLHDGGLFELPQGFPLGIDHTNEIGKSTYRNITPLQGHADIGLNHSFLGKIVANVRAMPIRVANRFDLETLMFRFIDTDGVERERSAYELGLNYSEANSVIYPVLHADRENPFIIEPFKEKFFYVGGFEGLSGEFLPDMEELMWDQVSEIAGVEVSEITTLTKLPRRIAKVKDGIISTEMLKRSELAISPDYYIVTFVNYLGMNVTTDEKLIDLLRKRVNEIEDDLMSAGVRGKLHALQFDKYISSYFDVEEIEIIYNLMNK